MFSKHFHLCFFKLKCPTATPPRPKHSSSSPSPSSASTFLFSDDFSSDSDSDSTRDPLPPDFSSLFASHRFFFSSPGLSNSIIESPDTRPTTTAHSRTDTTMSTLLPRGGGVGVPKYSLDPYDDFRRSMQEMIDSRESVDVTRDWDYLYDLLLCYLALNPSHTHRYIVRAFTDLVVHLLSSPPPSSSLPETTQQPPPPQ
ncbi:transcription repressor OFP12-like [Prosopis cineraria]|uniref:transcription repressor OFP12-like n=1 Tax=Prosopis cineraria TaxID=364024 RepID=UPI00240F49BE|nr:transcription repressor OFP12-like [Prosopis cineraria]